MWRNIVQFVTSWPIGWLADRVGHLPVLVAGYFIGAATAASTALAFWFAVDSIGVLTGIFFLAGLNVAVQESLESTVTADMVQAETITMSIGALCTVNGTTKFMSSATVGMIWTVVSPEFAFAVAAGFMLAGT